MQVHGSFKVDADAFIYYIGDMPSDSPLIVAWTNLMRAHRVAHGHVERRLKAEGLPPLAWYDALLEMERAGETPLRPFELETAMLLPQSNVSRLIDRIEEAGYLEKRTCPVDGRGVFLWITPAGKAMRRKMWPILSAAIEESLAGKLNAREAAQAAALLRRISD